MFKTLQYIGSIFFLLALTTNTYGQDAIQLNNPSFEDKPRAGGLGAYYLPITGWADCARSAYPNQTPPDIHPHSDAWMVSLPAAHGTTYLGMVVRDDDTHEFLSQALSAPLQAGKCYSFSVYLAQSETYMGQRILVSDTSFSYNRPFLTPSVLRIYAGNSLCDKRELLGESPPVTNDTWERFDFKFEPKFESRYIILEAFYKTPILEPYNGHILVDNCSDIVPIPCDEPVVLDEEEDAVATEVEEIADDTPPRPEPVENTAESKPVEQPEEKEAPRSTVMRELDRNNLKKGQTITIRKLYFSADSAVIKPESYQVLNELAEFLKYNQDVVIEIGGHTATVPPDFYCDSLSTERAKAVNDYLVGRGVPAVQLEFKGYGKRKPLIANDKQSYAARRKNQRVEIKVLSLDG